MQGANVGGALGITSEFFESLLPMQSILFGFAGYAPAFDCITVNPQLPSGLDELTITNVAWRDAMFDLYISQKEKAICIIKQNEPVFQVGAKTDMMGYFVTVK